MMILRHFLVRAKQGYRTIRFPISKPTLPEKFQGRPKLDLNKCTDSHCPCVDICPTDAISDSHSIDLGKCIFCGECEQACLNGAIQFTNDFKLAARKKEDLILSGNQEKEKSLALSREMLRMFGRSLKLRQVSAGGCNGCELETNVLQTIVFDISRFGIQFVASPRHADGLLITGPISKNMQLALEKTYQATADPKIVIAVGTCAISGGLFQGHGEVLGGAQAVVPVDLFIPGCPPHPITILDGLLRLLGTKTKS